MKKKKSNYKKYKSTYIKSTVSALFMSVLVLRGYTPFERSGENFFRIEVNGREVGVLGDKSQVEELLRQARRNVASGSDELVFLEAEMSVTGEEVLWGHVDREEDVLRNMEEALKSGIRETAKRAYTLKINEYIISLSSMEEVQSLLQAAIDKYGSSGKFAVELKVDPEREFGVLKADVVEALGRQETAEKQTYMEAGVQCFFSGLTGVQAVQEEPDNMAFEDFELGIHDMEFSEEVEIVETYLPESQITSLEDAVNLVLMEQETAAVYEVAAGDTLSEIAIKVNIPMDRIIEMNDILENENTILHIGDQLYITVPEPELSVKRVEEKYYEESYEADVIYIDNDSWYTNQSVLRQPPSAGLRKIIANVSYVNDREVGQEILKEEIVMEAVAKVVERGTIVPPTYIKPLSGGRQSSGFGRRSAPVKGASTYHKGIDWATPTGTAIYASCDGTVSRAGWGSGYGYVIYIDHEDGRQTRYAHLSKIQVSVGQKVKQWEKIALSGSTGNVSGPHLHFEMLINGSQVDPTNYLEK